MLCGWEGNRKSGVTLAMCHRLCGLSTYELNGHQEGDGCGTFQNTFTVSVVLTVNNSDYILMQKNAI